MSKTFYLGTLKSGAVVVRQSLRDYGYTHAGVRGGADFAAGQVVPLYHCSFSRTAAGARKNAEGQYRNGQASIEVVAVNVVDSATFRAATKKAKAGA
jgi:hypothetical protein